MSPSIITAKWNLLPPPPGACSECAIAHSPEQPHNAETLFYQIKFYGDNKRWPDWRDAMSHCAEHVKHHWRTELARLGVDVDAGQLSPLAEVKAQS